MVNRRPTWVTLGALMGGFAARFGPYAPPQYVKLTTLLDRQARPFPGVMSCSIADFMAYESTFFRLGDRCSSAGVIVRRRPSDRWARANARLRKQGDPGAVQRSPPTVSRKCTGPLVMLDHGRVHFDAEVDLAWRRRA